MRQIPEVLRSSKQIITLTVNSCSNFPGFVSTSGVSYPMICRARAHGTRTYESRQGRKAATAVCSVSAVVTLAFSIYDTQPVIYDNLRSCVAAANRKL
jgi:hypothetical protein